MSLSIGIVGLPNVGKSTLFNALTKKSVPSENYPFCTIDPSVGIVAVPDERLDKLAEFSKSEKKIPAAIEFTDIAGLVKGAAEGEGLGNQFLSHIREVDAIGHMVRIFDDSDITHVDGSVDPLRDIEVIHLELIFADQTTVQNRLAAVEKDLKRKDKEAMAQKPVLDKADTILKEAKLISSAEWSDDEKSILKNLHLLTAKPHMYILNKKSGAQNLDELNDERWQKLQKYLEENAATWTIVDAGVEHELKDMEGAEKKAFKAELGSEDGGIDELITKGYELLDLITFLTTGEAESRAWTTRRGSTAPEAGASIHSDFQEKFIKADVIHWDTLLEDGSKAVAREKGHIRTEGKEYIVEDGDVIEFKI